MSGQGELRSVIELPQFEQKLPILACSLYVCCHNYKVREVDPMGEVASYGWLSVLPLLNIKTQAIWWIIEYLMYDIRWVYAIMKHSSWYVSWYVGGLTEVFVCKTCPFFIHTGYPIINRKFEFFSKRVYEEIKEKYLLYK